jgi:hypothetical protein
MSHHLGTVQVQTLEKPVNDFSCEVYKKVVGKFCRTIFRRTQLCIKLKGGHFEDLNSQAIKVLN